MSRRRRRFPPQEHPAPDLPAAMEIAARYLGARPRSRWELEGRLRRSGISDEVREAAIERLVELGYVDDESFARWWAEQRDRHAPRGRRLVEAELRQRGVQRDVVEELRDMERPTPPNEDEVLPRTELERARTAIERHLRGRPLPDEPRALQRLGAFLMRRGFDPETVRAALRSADDWR